MTHLTFLLCLLFAAVAEAGTHPSPVDGWRSLCAGKICVQYARGHREIAERTLAIAGEVLPQIESFLRWKVSTRIYINLVDTQDAPNGWATMLPFNHVTLYMQPPTAFGELSDYNRWQRLLISHELTHIVHLDKGADAARLGRYVFGRFPLLFPNAFQPGVFTEGLATWVETDQGAGFGRGQNTWFSMMMRAEIDSGALSLGEAQQARSDWPVNQAYLYGVYFYEFLEDKYGKDKIPEYIDAYSTSVIPFLLSGPAEHVAKKNIRELWQEYLVWLAARFRPQIDTLRAAGLTAATQVTTRGYFTGRPVTLAGDRLAWVDFGLDGPSHIVVRETGGNVVQLGRVKSGADLIGVVGNDIFLLQEVPCGERRVFSDLFRMTATPGSHAVRLTHCGRYTAGSVSPDEKNLALVKSGDGIQALVVHSLVDGSDREIWKGGFDEQVAESTWVDAENIVIGCKQADKKWQLCRIARSGGELQPLPAELPRGNIATPFFDAATGTLYFAADHTGVFDIYRSDRDGSHVARVTRSLTGSLGPWVDRGQLYYTGYTAGGWNIFSASTNDAAIADVPDLHDSGNVSRGMHLTWPDTDTLSAEQKSVLHDKRYSALPALLPRSWFLAGFSTGDANELGIAVNGNDALYFHQYIAGVARELELGQNSGMIDYIGWHHLHIASDRHFDVTGNGVAPGHTGYSVLTYHVVDTFSSTLFWTEPFLFSSATVYAGVNRESDRFHDLQATATLRGVDTRTDTSGVGLEYVSSGYFPHAISESHGRRITAGFEQDDLQTTLFPTGAASVATASQGDVAFLDWREYLPLGGRHVLALRGFAGRGDPGSDPFSLGAHLNTVALPAPAVHERDISLRGYSSDAIELSDNNAELFSAEWRLPLADVGRGLNGRPLGLHKLHAAFFYDGGRSWGTAPNPVSRQDARLYDSVGGEFIALIDIGYSMLPLQARIGYARALEQASRGDTDNFYFTFGAEF